MKTSVKRLYEAMFLVDSAAPESSVEDRMGGDSISSAARKILEKAGVEIVLMKRWDERKLTYEIAGRDRGTYILCYFHADGQKIRQIEQDARLSEKIMRVLILGTEGRDKEYIERDIASQPAAAGKKPDEIKTDGSRPVAGAVPSKKQRTGKRERRTEETGEETTPVTGN